MEYCARGARFYALLPEVYLFWSGCGIDSLKSIPHMCTPHLLYIKKILAIWYSAISDYQDLKKIKSTVLAEKVDAHPLAPPQLLFCFSLHLPACSPYSPKWPFTWPISFLLRSLTPMLSPSTTKCPPTHSPDYSFTCPSNTRLLTPTHLPTYRSPQWGAQADAVAAVARSPWQC